MEEFHKGNIDYEEISNAFLHRVSDNVDHNIATLTGKDTFHGMGIIKVEQIQFETFRRIPRNQNRTPAVDFIKRHSIEFVPYQKLDHTKQFQPMSILKGIRSIDFDVKMSTYDFL